MKKMILSMLFLVYSFSAQAYEVSSQKHSISPASIDKAITLVDKSGSPQHKKVNVIVTDSGMSTDVSPRYTVYLGFASMAEMGNISASFKVNDQASKFISASRKSAGIYEVKTIEVRDEGMYEVTQMIDAVKMFSDEQKLRKNCGDDFCDHELKTKIIISETIKKLN